MRTKNVSILMVAVVATAIAASGCATSSAALSDDKAETAKAPLSPFASMLAAGKYDHVNPRITEESFPVNTARFTADGSSVFCIFNEMTTVEVEAAIRKEGYDPATIEQLLAYGAEHPEEQLKHPVVALGSSWVGPSGHRSVPALGSVDHRRDVRLYWSDLEWPMPLWNGYHCFLAVRKATATSADAAAPKSVRTLAYMLAVGNYDWVDENITEKRFAVVPERFETADLRIFSIDKASSSLAVEAKMRGEGYEPATIEQLLAYGAEHPEEQRQYPIVALGSSTIYTGDPSVAPPGGDSYVSYLSADSGKRFVALVLNGPGVRWGTVNRFLAAPEVQP